MFFHVFKYRLKILFGRKTVLFWTLIFPIILSTFFNLAFSNLTESEQLKPVSIAVVSNETTDSSKAFTSVIDSLSKGDNKLFVLKKADNEEAAKELLKENKITGYYLVGSNIEMVVKTSGINETIMKSVSDEFEQQIAMITKISSIHPEALASGILNELNKNQTYITDKSNQNVDVSVIYFYTVIGMVCIYAGFFGMDAANDTEANQSTKGARISVAPTHKLKVLGVSLLVGFIIQYIEMLILLAYLILILGIDFGTQILPILFLMFVGCFAGCAFGTFIGVCNRKGEAMKVGIFLSATMTCCFLAGMMMIDMKIIIANNIPILGYINPVAAITDALYSLYYYSNLDRYFFNVACIAIFGIVMTTASYYFVRRKKYDSI